MMVIDTRLGPGRNENLLLVEDLLGLVHLVVEQLKEERHLLRQLRCNQLPVSQRAFDLIKMHCFKYRLTKNVQQLKETF